jgi:protease-4
MCQAMRGTKRWKATLAGLALVLIGGVMAAPAGAERNREAIVDYHEMFDFMPQSPSVTGGAVGAFANPAAWATAGESEFAFWWNDRTLRRDRLDNWGFSLGKHLGFSLQNRTFAGPGGSFDIYDYQLGLAVGDREGALGLAWRWSSGDEDVIRRESAIALGSFHRPNRFLSYGASEVFSVESGAWLGVLDLGLRPLGRPWLTLFGDYALRDGEDADEGRWGAGLEVRPVAGVHLGVKLRDVPGEDDFRYTLNLGVTLDAVGFHVEPGYDRDGDLGTTSYLVRLGPPHRGLPAARTIRSLLGRQRIVPVDLEDKTLTYQKDRWFDSEHVAWIDLTRHLDAIRDEPTVRGVAVNMAGLRARPSLVWELRRKLAELREEGKVVLVHAERLGMTGTYLASVATTLQLDPEGALTLPGLAFYRTYVRGLLDKLGIGVEEWRYFTYKSAMEGLSRRQMSDADREQLGRLIDVIYEELRRGVCDSRGLTVEEFDRIVDSEIYLTPSLALELGLVDRIGRWKDLKSWIQEEEPRTRVAGLPPDAWPRSCPDERWGALPRIEIVYAEGICAMDTGIKGRATSKRLAELASDRDVAGVVLRADSPGGDALPSDLVAGATRRLREAGKPVVVSQGDVAGSGGYWISMEGTKILTTPFTLTGSIGVIGGWFWDDGFGEKTGFGASGVKRGASADLFTGIRFPIVGGPLPVRNLEEKEKGLVRRRMMQLYDGFVAKVSEARDLPESRVRELGEGRVWVGADAVENGLCDGYGTLEDAVAEARSLAGIGPDEEVEITEFPERKLFSLPSLGPEIPPYELLFSWLPWTGGAARAQQGRDPGPDYETLYYRAIAGKPGEPLLLVPPALLPRGWGGAE